MGLVDCIGFASNVLVCSIGGAFLRDNSLLPSLQALCCFEEMNDLFLYLLLRFFQQLSSF